jgi:hypothetical protein
MVVVAEYSGRGVETWVVGIRSGGSPLSWPLPTRDLNQKIGTYREMPGWA